MKLGYWKVRDSWKRKENERDFEENEDFWLVKRKKKLEDFKENKKLGY